MARYMTQHKNKILHVDADSFFASCERAVHPEYANKPVCVTGGKHGIILAATYDAKALGIYTGMPVWEAYKLLPRTQAYYVSSDFQVYAQYSDRMFQIFRDVTPDVEEYSVDEAFLDVGGMRMMYRTSFVGIASMIRDRVWHDLGLRVSIGVGPTKTLAKMGSKLAKPGKLAGATGVYDVPRKNLDELYQTVDLDAVPGFGPNTVELLHKFGITSLAGFVALSEDRVRSLLHKPGVVLWHELLGRPAMPVAVDLALPKSLSRIRTFRPTSYRQHILIELANHLFVTCYKLRRQGLRAKTMLCYVRDGGFRTRSIEVSDTIAHNSSTRFLTLAQPQFAALLDGTQVRAVGVVFSKLERDDVTQLSVFDADTRVQRQETLFHSVDQMNNKYGRYTVRPAVLMGTQFQGSKKQGRHIGALSLGRVT